MHFPVKVLQYCIFLAAKELDLNNFYSLINLLKKDIYHLLSIDLLSRVYTYLYINDLYINLYINLYI